MPEQNSHTALQDLYQKLSALRNKIILQQSLVQSITADFESLYAEIESMNSSVESTSINAGVARDVSGSTSDKFDSSSSKSDSTNTGSGSTSQDAESSNPHNGASSLDVLTDKIIRSTAALKITFYQPNIPARMAKILRAISQRKSLSVAEMMELTNASRNSIVRDMKILKQLGWIKFNGSRKNGFFTLTDEGVSTVTSP